MRQTQWDSNNNVGEKYLSDLFISLENDSHEISTLGTCTIYIIERGKKNNAITNILSLMYRDIFILYIILEK